MMPQCYSYAVHILAQTQAALSPVFDIQMLVSPTISFSIPGFPTDTAPITNAIGFVSLSVPLGDSISVYCFIDLSSALELVPTIYIPVGM